MAFIEVHQTLPSHRKIMRLRRLLKIEPAQAVGHMVSLWCWALDNAQDGNLSPFEADEVAEAAMWKKDPEKFYQAMQESGFVDEDNYLHDWDDYAGRLMEQREYRKEQNRVRKQRQRDRDKRDSHAGVTRDMGVTQERDKRDSHDTTVPYRTVPYSTIPNNPILSKERKERKKESPSVTFPPDEELPHVRMLIRCGQEYTQEDVETGRQIWLAQQRGENA